MREIRNMGELRLERQKVKYKIRYLEDELKDQSTLTVHAFKKYVRNMAFETGMKIVLGLFLQKRKNRKQKEKEQALDSS
jgi:hypothetical protein